jgi:hypothetical protein
MKLSEHFTLEEFLISSTASKYNIENIATLEHTSNLKYLCEKVLEPLRNYIEKPIYITSGYRSKALNDKMKEVGYSVAANSQHMQGQAADIVVHGMTNEEIIEAFHGAEIEFDQLIDETSISKNGDKSFWVHVSYNAEGNRNKCFKLVNNKVA